MGSTIQTYVRADQCPVSNRHQACIQNGAVEVNEDTLADLQVGAVIDPEWSLDPWIFLELFSILVLILMLWWQWSVIPKNTGRTL